MSVQTESHASLHGKWLLIVQIAWGIGLVTLAVMYVLGFLAVRQVLSKVCEEKVCTLARQMRHVDGDQVVNWPGPPIGYADPLRPDQAEALTRLGLTLDEYGWLGALQMGIPALIYLLIAAGLFWRKPHDWMVLFVSVMVATFPLQDMPLPFSLAVHQPGWEWVHAPGLGVALSCFLIFPLLFPTGRFVPRWTRWMALFELAGAGLVTLLRNSVLEIPREANFVMAYLLLSFGTGVYAQLYRYFRVASPAERQQIKWVIVGLAGFVVTALAVLIPLDRLSISRAAGMDPAQALILSAIPDTLFRAISLFIPVSIAISVLRYRLWDIDIIISRTLVYGTLSAGIVVTYILLVGLLGALLTTNAPLAALLLTVTLTVLFFQSLRARLQHAVDRVTFSGGEVPGPKQVIEELPSEAEVPLRQHWLAWWLFDLICVLSTLSFIFLALSWVTPVADTWGFRGDAVILALTFGSIGLLLARRHPQNPIGWLLLAAGLVNALVEFCIEYATYALLTKPGTLPGGTLAAWLASWLWVVAIAMLIYTFLFFPTGHLPSARWRPAAWFLVVAFVLLALTFMIQPGPLYFAPYLDNPFAIQTTYRVLSPLQIVNASAVLLIGISIILRLRRAQGIERQQLKWFAYAAIMMTVIGMIDSLAGAVGLTGRDPKSYQYLTMALWIAIPFTIAFAILRYRLWDIDVLINRTLVYGTLSAGIVVLYILLVGLLGGLLTAHVGLAAALATAALSAPFFQPLRLRLQRAVNRRMAGGQELPGPKQEFEDSQPEAEMRWRPGWLELAHGAWFGLALLAAIVLIGALPLYYSQFSQSVRMDPHALGKLHLPFQVLIGASELASSFLSFALALLLFWRKPMERMALFSSFFFLYTSMAWGHSLDFFLSAYLGMPSTFKIWSRLSVPPSILLVCTFPDGRFLPRWTRGIFFVSILATWVAFAIPAAGIAVYPLFFIATFAQVYRYRVTPKHAQRQQTKWVVFGLVVSLALALVASFIYKTPSPPIINILPLVLTLAILRSHLWNIDVIINRALVYGVLTAGIVVLYIVLVGALGVLSQTTGNLLISLLATGLIAFLFQPLRERLQRGVNHFLYGDRDDPYAALSRLGRRLEASLAPDAVLPTVVTTVREVLKLPYVAIYLPQDSPGYKIVAESASPSLRLENGRIIVPGMNREGLCIPLIHQGETLGYIVLGPRAANEAFGSTDLRLLDDLAPQVGAAVHAVRLTADLQRSRERLVLAREEERRRLRRDLHDDLAPTLASLGLTASTAADLIPTNPATATQLVKELQAEIRATVGNIRRLVYDLRPPTLDELGLLPAVRERAAQYSNAPGGLHMRVEAPGQLPALPAAVEVAAYRIVQEALENVSKHSQARQCTIRIANHDGLEIEITDDGIGLPQNLTPGVGLRSMRERAEELGGTYVIERGANGGTRILARLPTGESNGSITGIDRG
jgi:signal transduction histidine kinase